LRFTGGIKSFQSKMYYFQGVSPSKTFGDASKKVLGKEVYITASGPREVATFAGGM